MNNRNRKNCDYFGKLCKFFCPEDPFLDDFEDEYDYDRQEQKMKENVKDKLLTDEKYTFEEYLKLLELVTNKYRTSFNTGNGKYEIVFREITVDERFKLNRNIESKQTEEKER